ncbi:MAG TPA: MarR family transcriptional regulator [Baekduia sp.]|uniref:MarR family winged helix-turn-helix transcriptional regulator n=1 Tax=Baekduia sp. TaxID=2600305 RepID=UPI002D76F093|nr:MarR family transcriptional regulator [Baekduia sp.]HET6505430.1 MarR family transcriptional regulator [Baekduia sp.]
MSDPPAVPPTAVRAAHELRVCLTRLRRTLRRVAGTTDLTPSQTSVLSRLMHDGPAGTSDLAVAEGVRPQSMAATVAALREREMVDRRPDPTDGRRQLIALTDAAHAYVAGHRRTREEWLAVRFAERFTEAERGTILQALELLTRIEER